MGGRSIASSGLIGMRRHSALGLVLLVLAVPVRAQNDPVATSLTGRIARARDYLAAFIDSSAVPGMAVAVAVAGEVVWTEGFGTADLETGTPMTPSTPVRIGSVSKALTGRAPSP